MKLIVTNPNHQQAINTVINAGQEHILRFWNELDNSSQNNLISQINEIDFELLEQLGRKIKTEPSKENFKKNPKPADFIKLPETQEERAIFNKAKLLGEQALENGRVAAFLVAGGHGTRIGVDGPKGKLPITPLKNKTLFQLHTEKVIATSKRYGTTIPFYIMTSETNQDETIDFFEQNNYFGLEKNNVIFLKQGLIPALDPDGKLILEQKGSIYRSPNGHGGALSALVKSLAIEDMKDRGVDLLFYFNVDNVLIKICDPIFIGFHLLENAEMSAKIVTKSDPMEKFGVFGYIDDILVIIEYSDMAYEDQIARRADGELKFRAGSIAIHLFNIEFIERLNHDKLQLPWHLAFKKVSYIDRNGKLVSPEPPNAFKFESYIFDALSFAKKTMLLQVDRKEEFSPVKNLTGHDSLSTARFDLINQHHRWLVNAGVSLGPMESIKEVIEISPLFALDEEDLKNKIRSNFKIYDGLYLG